MIRLHLPIMEPAIQTNQRSRKTKALWPSTQPVHRCISDIPRTYLCWMKPEKSWKKWFCGSTKHTVSIFHEETAKQQEEIISALQNQRNTQQSKSGRFWKNSFPMSGGILDIWKISCQPDVHLSKRTLLQYSPSSSFMNSSNTCMTTRFTRWRTGLWVSASPGSDQSCEEKWRHP